MYVYIYIYIYIYPAAETCPCLSLLCLPLMVSVKKSLLLDKKTGGEMIFQRPNQGLDCSFCGWTAGQGLAQKECVGSQTPVCQSLPVSAKKRSLLSLERWPCNTPA